MSSADSSAYCLWLSLVCLLCLSVVFERCMSCNEAVCASIVSKCMLTQSCKCNHGLRHNRTCSRDCYHCLDYLYHDCCSCVEMCPKPNNNESSLASKSHVEELPEPQHDLFAVLTEERDHLLRWTSYSIPLKVVIMESLGSQPHKELTKTDGSDGIDIEKDIAVNCTVAYMSQCMSWNKCKSSCTSMGATSYRWFHDGCCECVGSYCINYGMNESKCLQCPLTHETDDDGNQTLTEQTDDRITDYDIEEDVGRHPENEEENGSENTLTAKVDKNEKKIQKSDESLKEEKKEMI